MIDKLQASEESIFDRLNKLSPDEAKSIDFKNFNDWNPVITKESLYWELNEMKRDDSYWDDVKKFLDFNYEPELISLMEKYLWAENFEKIKVLLSKNIKYENLSDKEKLEIFKLISLIDGLFEYQEWWKTLSFEVENTDIYKVVKSVCIDQINLLVSNEALWN